VGIFERRKRIKMIRRRNKKFRIKSKCTKISKSIKKD